MSKSGTIQSSFKTGDTKRWEQSLTDPMNVAELFGGSLVGVTYIAQVRDRRGTIIYNAPMAVISPNATSVIIEIPASVTLNQVIGEKVVMDILYSNGVTGFNTHSSTVYFQVLDGITQNIPTDRATGSFLASDFVEEDFMESNT